jgi:hypothetical protein
MGRESSDNEDANGDYLCGLNTGEGEGFVIVQVFNDFVVRCPKGRDADFKEVGIDSIHSVTIPLHETAKFTSAELRGLYHQEARVS